jgi:hypothetical protein
MFKDEAVSTDQTPKCTPKTHTQRTPPHACVLTSNGNDNALGCVVNFFRNALKMTLLGKVGGEPYASYAQKTRSPRLKRQMKLLGDWYSILKSGWIDANKH